MIVNVLKLGSDSNACQSYPPDPHPCTCPCRACGPGALHDLRSATVNNTRLACAAASHGLIGHLRHFSQPLMKSIAMFLGAFDARVAEHLEGLAGEGSEPPARVRGCNEESVCGVR